MPVWMFSLRGRARVYAGARVLERTSMLPRVACLMLLGSSLMLLCSLAISTATFRDAQVLCQVCASVHVRPHARALAQVRGDLAGSQCHGDVLGGAARWLLLALRFYRPGSAHLRLCKGACAQTAVHAQLRATGPQRGGQPRAESARAMRTLRCRPRLRHPSHRARRHQWCLCVHACSSVVSVGLVGACA